MGKHKRKPPPRLQPEQRQESEQYETLNHNTNPATVQIEAENPRGLRRVEPFISIGSAAGHAVKNYERAWIAAARYQDGHP